MWTWRLWTFCWLGWNDGKTVISRSLCYFIKTFKYAVNRLQHVRLLPRAALKSTIMTLFTPVQTQTTAQSQCTAHCSKIYTLNLWLGKKEPQNRKTTKPNNIRTQWNIAVNILTLNKSAFAGLGASGIHWDEEKHWNSFKETLIF